MALPPLDHVINISSSISTSTYSRTTKLAA